MMKKLLAILLATLLMTSAIGCASSSKTGAASGGDEKSSSGTITLRLAHINPKTDPKEKEAEKFAELVKEKTNGAVNIDIYAGGVLGNTDDIIKGLKLGTDDIVIEGFGTLPSYTKLAYLDNVPYLFRDYDHFMKVWTGEVGDSILKDSGDQADMKLFGPSYRGVRVLTSVKKVTSVDDLKGLKIRVPNDTMSLKTWQALGCNPTPMDMTEVLTGLQQHTIEAQENPIILSYSYGLYDVCKYLIQTNHRNSADVFMMNLEKFSQLSPSIQKALTDSGKEAAEYVSKVNYDGENEYLKKWQEKGVEIITPDLTGFKQKCSGIIDSDFPDLKEYVSKIQAVQ